MGARMSKLSHSVALAWLRSAAIGGLFATLIGGQTYAVVAQRELWPVSNYPMYAHSPGSSVSAIQVDGILADGTRYAVSVPRELAPFDPPRLVGFMRRVDKGKRRGERRVEATRALLDLYEKHRLSGRHTGPKLERMEVFETTWRIVPFAANIAHPKARRLIASAGLGDSE
jgi:hypothetical protein